MEWADLKKLKEQLTRDATKPLGTSEARLLVWLVEEERKYRFALPTASRVSKALREQVEALVPEGEGQAAQETEK